MKALIDGDIILYRCGFAAQSKIYNLFLPSHLGEAPKYFAFEMTHSEKKARVSRSMGYLKHMVALDDWGSEDMTKVNAAISAGTTFVG